MILRFIVSVKNIFKILGIVLLILVSCNSGTQHEEVYLSYTSPSPVGIIEITTNGKFFWEFAEYDFESDIGMLIGEFVDGNKQIIDTLPGPYFSTGYFCDSSRYYYWSADNDTALMIVKKYPEMIADDTFLISADAENFLRDTLWNSCFSYIHNTLITVGNRTNYVFRVYKDRWPELIRVMPSIFYPILSSDFEIVYYVSIDTTFISSNSPFNVFEYYIEIDSLVYHGVIGNIVAGDIFGNKATSNLYIQSYYDDTTKCVISVNKVNGEFDTVLTRVDKSPHPQNFYFNNVLYYQSFSNDTFTIKKLLDIE